MEREKIESVIESLLFIWGEPMSSKMIGEAIGIDQKEVYATMVEMQEKYEKEDRGVVIRRINKSFQLVSKRENYAYVEQLIRPIKQKKLSQSALEVLAIIAYKQPVTRGEIEAVRGVKSDKAVEGLIDKGFIVEKGRSNAIGRPALFGTTDKFLEYMGLTDLGELPDIEEFVDDFSKLSQWERNQISIDDINEKELHKDLQGNSQDNFQEGFQGNNLKIDDEEKEIKQ